MWKQYFDSLFPIKIDRKQDVLIIADHRPSDELLLSVTLAVGALLASVILFRPLVTGGSYWLLLLFLLPIPIFVVRSLVLPFREKYVFNKGQAIYTLTRQGLLKRHTMEGDLRKIPFVQMERKAIATKRGTREVFLVVLLQRQILLLGASDAMVLREETPIGSCFESEARIANDIADFLGLPVPEIVNV